MENNNEYFEILNFDRKTKCDFCGCTEICAITHYGTTHYNRLICLECALSIDQNELLHGVKVFDLNKSKIRFKNFVVDITKEDENEEKEEDEEEIPLF
jgi:transcription elongation factor Elf1